jgi:hypothetical protein
MQFAGESFGAETKMGFRENERRLMGFSLPVTRMRQVVDSTMRTKRVMTADLSTTKT